MTLSDPAAVMARLEEIDRDLCTRQNALESAAMDWYRTKRDREHKWAVKFLSLEGTVAERKAAADAEVAAIGKESEACYESLRAVVRVLETRASIGQSILKAQSRV